MTKALPLLLGMILLSGSAVYAKREATAFTMVKEIRHTPIIDQDNTGTCWSFATTSFLESEIMRLGFPETDLSEMFFVYHTYQRKAEDFLLYQGSNSFSQGGQAHDVINTLRKSGMATFKSYPGVKKDGKYSDSKLLEELNKEVSTLNRKSEKFDASDLESLEPILKKGLGRLPKDIQTDEGTSTPSEFRDKFGIDPDNYIELSSYNHHPFYKPFVLEVPDNWSHDLYYNLPIDELVEVMYYSLMNGYTFCWDGDTSEKTFQHKKGLADLPGKEIGKVDQELRQKTFFDRTTTDDHLMHIVGLSKYSDGRNCFYTKNSWGADSNEFGGYLQMTEDYVRLKTIAILVHKDAIPDHIKEKLKL